MKKAELGNFAGPEGKRRLIEALRAHAIVGDEKPLAKKIAKQTELKQLAAGEILLKQNGKDKCVYLVISGEFAIEVNGRRVATSGPGTTIGEMALLDPKGGRSASATAAASSIVAKITQARFLKLAKDYPQIWRAIARELARRVRRHNKRF